MALNDFLEKINLNIILQTIAGKTIGALLLLALLVIGIMGLAMRDMYTGSQFRAIQQERDAALQKEQACDQERRQTERLMYQRADSIANALFFQKMQYLNVNNTASTITITPEKKEP